MVNPWQVRIRDLTLVFFWLNYSFALHLSMTLYLYQSPLISFPSIIVFLRSINIYKEKKPILLNIYSFHTRCDLCLHDLHGMSFYSHSLMVYKTRLRQSILYIYHILTFCQVKKFQFRVISYTNPGLCGYACLSYTYFTRWGGDVG